MGFSTLLSDHNCAIEDLYGRSVSGTSLYRGALRKIYDPPIKILTPGLTIDEAADLLETYDFEKDIHMVERSTDFCDYNQLRTALKSVHKESLMPPLLRCLDSYIHGVTPTQVSLSHSNYRIYTGYCSQKAIL
jgi:hypothetical protein